MDDVASVKSENANLRRIQNKLLEWDIQDCPLAPLTPSQRDFIYELSQISADQSFKEDSTAGQVTQDGNTRIETTQEFLNYFAEVEEELVKGDDLRFVKYYDKLAERDVECDILLGQINASLSCLSQLVAEHTLVSTKTSALHLASEQLLADQNSLHDIGEEVRHRLHYFTQVEHLNQRLSSPTLSVSSDMFIDILNKIDECMEYIKEHSTFKESPGFLVKYRHCLARAIALIRTYVTQTLIHATEQMLAPRSSLDSIAAGSTPASADTFALFYGKFQACAPKVKKIIQEVENRMEKSDEYINLITECQQCFLSQRVQVMSGGVSAGVQHISTAHKGDHCSLVRSGCAFLIHVCEDEHRLFYQFFSKPSIHLTSYLEGLCTTLYDNLRPFIIHVNHLETLAELCSILRVEMLDDHVQNSPESLEAFSRIAWQLLQDIQERLVFRAHLYLQSDILNYKPAPGDLAYPEKLEMMESIAQSLQEQPLRRSDSRSSLVSVGSTTSQEVAKINADTHMEQPRSRTGNSPADLHGMWYPPVRRTLVCLSRLYRCVERPIFQGLSQEALSLCIHSIANASHQITANKTAIDGELFQIKHLLILREQIAPFQVDFTVKEMSLDFSKVKTAAFSLLHKRKHLFSLGTNNALLEFLLEGTPQVKEQLLDSRKDVDRQLKSSCETFIKYSTSLLAGPVINFNEKAQTIVRVASETQKPVTLRAQPWASPAQVGGLIQESQRYIKTRLAGIQRSMQLYLANKDTEFILFRPIRNNIVAAYVKLEQLLTSGGYSTDDLIIASCPTPEQVSVIISSASLLAEGTPQVAHSAGPSRKTSVQSVSFASANSLRHQTLSEETKEPTQNVFTV